MLPELLPISVVIATRNRAAVLRQMLESLAGQSAQPETIVIVDSSDRSCTREMLDERTVEGLHSTLHWYHAEIGGAAAQRNQGVLKALQPFVAFFDDDILFEANCMRQLWHAIKSNERIGGVNAMIMNQRYVAPGVVSRAMFAVMHGRRERSYAGKVIGPAINLLPEDRDDLPAIVPVEWLNTTCTVYRREALPDPPFDRFFTGYSLMEDLALSLNVTKRGWKLANARTARIQHHSQPAAYKADVTTMAAMELVNRHYIMTEVMRKTTVVDFGRLALWEAFSVASTLRATRGLKTILQTVAGKFRAASKILRSR